MKLINSIFILFLLTSCGNKEERFHSEVSIVEKQEQIDVKDSPKPDRLRGGIVGSFKEELEITDPQLTLLKSLIKERNKNKEIISIVPNQSESFTTYLGEITFYGIRYDVFKLYFTVQAAIVKHGHSELIFLSSKNATYFDVETADNLPYDLKDGLFRYLSQNDTLQMKVEHFSKQALVLGVVESTP